MFATYGSEKLPSFLAAFFTLSYPTTPPAQLDSFHDSRYYATGVLDACLVVTCIGILTVLRDMTRVYLMEPIARWKLTRDWETLQHKKISANGAPKSSVVGSSTPDHTASYKHGEHVTLTMSRRDVRRVHRNMSRFGEQGWSFIYYAASFTFGVYLHHKFPTRILHLKEDLWRGYPHVPLAGTVKFYYLIQTAFYTHQMVVLMVEARRKDHVIMMIHHIITVILLVGSYACNLTRAGCVFILLTDCCDVLLPLAKMLVYMALNTLSDATFIIFLACWCITRHVLFIIALKSVVVDSLRIVPEMWAPERGCYFSHSIHKTVSLLLVLIQVLQIIWFTMICRVAYRIVTGQGASDVRSDEEDDHAHRE